MKKQDNNVEVDLAELSVDVRYIKTEVMDIKRRLDDNFATKDWVNSEYGPIKKMFWGLLTLVATTIVVAVLKLVIQP